MRRTRRRRPSGTARFAVSPVAATSWARRGRAPVATERCALAPSRRAAAPSAYFRSSTCWTYPRACKVRRSRCAVAGASPVLLAITVTPTAASEAAINSKTESARWIDWTPGGADAVVPLFLSSVMRRWVQPVTSGREPPGGVLASIVWCPSCASPSLDSVLDELGSVEGRGWRCHVLRADRVGGGGPGGGTPRMDASSNSMVWTQVSDWSPGRIDARSCMRQPGLALATMLAPVAATAAALRSPSARAGSGLRML